MNGPESGQLATFLQLAIRRPFHVPHLTAQRLNRMAVPRAGRWMPDQTQATKWTQDCGDTGTSDPEGGSEEHRKRNAALRSGAYVERQGCEDDEIADGLPPVCGLVAQLRQGRVFNGRLVRRRD